MPLFLKYAQSEIIDIFFVSDLDFSIFELPINVHIIKCSFEEIKKRIEKITSYKVKWNKPYKLCDLKPLYGLIFQDIIVDYQYWAFGDCDLIYGGCLDKVLIKILKEEYDIISLLKLWINGSFCILKNTGKVNHLFLDNCKEIGTVIQNEKSYAADECGLVHGKLLAGYSLIELKNEITSFTEVIIRHPEIKWFHEDIIKDVIYNEEIIKVEGNKITSTKKLNEIPILHFVCNKYDPLFSFPCWKTIPNKFYIDKFGFYTKKSLIRTINNIGRIIKKKGIMIYSKCRRVGRHITNK